MTTIPNRSALSSFLRRPGAETAPSLQQLFSQPYVGLVDVDIVIASNAQRLGEEYTLKPPDAIHLATAIQHNCYELLAWDDDFVRRVNRMPAGWRALLKL